MRTPLTHRLPRIGLHLPALCWLLLAPLLSAATPDIVVLAGDRVGSALVVTPWIARMAGPDGTPHLLVQEKDGEVTVLRALSQVGPSEILHLGPLAVPYPEGIRLRAQLPQLAPGTPLFQLGVSIAKLGWGKPGLVVMAPSDHHESFVLSAALAARLRAPLIPHDGGVSVGVALSAVRELNPGKILLVAPARQKRPAWYSNVQSITEVITPPEVSRRLVERIGRDHVRNVAVFTPPGSDESRGGELAAYYSLRRDSLLVFARKADGEEVDRVVWSQIEAHSVRPRTVTLIGSEFELPGREIEFPGTLPDAVEAEGYRFAAEPMSIPRAGRAVTFGVGRLHLPSVGSASALLLRTFHREGQLARYGRVALMIANPNPASNLPLAETTARVTGQEFRNTRVKLTEFYGTPSDSREVREAARGAGVIVYQGHSSDQHVLESESPFEAEPESDFSPEGAAVAGMPRYRVVEEGEPYVTRPRGTGPPHEDFESLSDIELNALPLVVLQSCNSMASYYIDPYFERGAVAVVGSVTSIHSGSGSAFARAYSHGLLYLTNNAGEALRFAKNFLLTMRDLKQRRGHQNLHPGWRVAHSFRLYGDPELVVFDPDALKRRRRVVHGAWGGEAVEVHVPARRFEPVVTAKYSARMLPGTFNAGIVRSLPDSEIREVMPFQFFTLALGEATGFKPGAGLLARSGDKSIRTVHLFDELDSRVYVLHFPRNEPEGKYFKLRTKELSATGDDK